MLGRWIHGPGPRREMAEFARLRETHRTLHDACAEILEPVRAGQRDEALERLHGDDYERVSEQLVGAIVAACGARGG